MKSLVRISLCGGLLLLLSCSHWVAQVIPVGEPVTQERCQQLSTFRMGNDDGHSGRRKGERLDQWKKNCAAQGVELSNESYNEGYDTGLRELCSCEKGAISASRDEYEEFKIQSYACTKELLKNEFLRGRNLVLSQKTQMGKSNVELSLESAAELCRRTSTEQQSP